MGRLFRAGAHASGRLRWTPVANAPTTKSHRPVAEPEGRPERLSSPPRALEVERRHTECALGPNWDSGLDRLGGLPDATALGRRLGVRWRGVRPDRQAPGWWSSAQVAIMLQFWAQPPLTVVRLV